MSAAKQTDGASIFGHGAGWNLHFANHVCSELSYKASV